MLYINYNSVRLEKIFTEKRLQGNRHTWWVAVSDGESRKNCDSFSLHWPVFLMMSKEHFCNQKNKNKLLKENKIQFSMLSGYTWRKENRTGDFSQLPFTEQFFKRLVNLLGLVHGDKAPKPGCAGRGERPWAHQGWEVRAVCPPGNRVDKRGPFLVTLALVTVWETL